MPAPDTAANMTISLPGNITSSDCFSFSISNSGHDTIDVTPLTQDGGARTLVSTPLGSQFEASVSYYGSGAACAIGSAGNITLGDTTFYGVCTSSTATAAVNDVARYDATFKQISST